VNKLFLDTGYVLALELANDQNHARVAEHWRQYAGGPPPLITTSLVFCEIVTFFNTRGYHRKAVQVGESLLRSQGVEIVHVDAALLEAGWDMIRRQDDKRYSLTDAVSFALMRTLAITIALTTDRHFEQAGFRVEPHGPR
jgi:predicted nucleic acid-binding protein